MADSSLAGKVALVTGGSRGIGRAIVDRIAAAGALVAVHHSSVADESAGEPDAVKELVESLTAAGRTAFAVDLDFGDHDDGDRLTEAVVAGLRSHGVEPRLDIVVNNAGITSRTPFGQVTGAHVDRLFAVNARAPFLLLQRVTELLARGARVVNVSSGLTRIAEPVDPQQELAHAMSKAALEMLTLHLARPLAARGITVNTVAPGIVDVGDPALSDPVLRDRLAGLSPFGRCGTTDDVADLVEFLVSERSRWTTGQRVAASGGAAG
ncbi:SDR family NAD(P)-dependent oxidoreductase [Pseudonocardia endophytica]|uniref:NAD(P)-dependent dehydrogenase (Short-subunit alcohol dehydrogenase family) n=1 Tax=Pseudonocardia endophytica TaxID=401976 RepID=A0A4R1HJN9_PSEEN|nr:SDR family oxidoreductase [Pseudonocardia endophytica]TCK22078.1 NAD(P)-dependent dehydrogenase (short-subunit alcohol dehydrogenase family) [Pseudonocardia endophytica]